MKKVKLAKLNSSDEVPSKDQASIHPSLILYIFHCGHFKILGVYRLRIQGLRNNLQSS